MKLQTAIKIAN